MCVNTLHQDVPSDAKRFHEFKEQCLLCRFRKGVDLFVVLLWHNVFEEVYADGRGSLFLVKNKVMR